MYKKNKYKKKINKISITLELSFIPLNFFKIEEIQKEVPIV